MKYCHNSARDSLSLLIILPKQLQTFPYNKYKKLTCILLKYSVHFFALLLFQGDTNTITQSQIVSFEDSYPAAMFSGNIQMQVNFQRLKNTAQNFQKTNLKRCF